MIRDNLKWESPNTKEREIVVKEMKESIFFKGLEGFAVTFMLCLAASLFFGGISNSYADSMNEKDMLLNNVGIVLINFLIIGIYAWCMISDYKRLKSARNGLFIVMHGQCYDKMAEREAFSTRRVSYHVKLGQDNNKENLIQADISENDFEKCMLGTNMFAVRLVRKTKNGVEIDSETSAYLSLVGEDSHFDKC